MSSITTNYIMATQNSNNYPRNASFKSLKHTSIHSKAPASIHLKAKKKAHRNAHSKLDIPRVPRLGCVSYQHLKFAIIGFSLDANLKRDQARLRSRRKDRKRQNEKQSNTHWPVSRRRTKQLRAGEIIIFLFSLVSTFHLGACLITLALARSLARVN